MTEFCVWDHRENKFQFPDRGLFTAMNKHFPDEWCLLTQNTILLHIVKTLLYINKLSPQTPLHGAHKSVIMRNKSIAEIQSMK